MMGPYYPEVIVGVLVLCTEQVPDADAASSPRQAQRANLAGVTIAAGCAVFAVQQHTQNTISSYDQKASTLGASFGPWRQNHP